MSVYYISPHYDDAIGSCGGKIYLDFLAQQNPNIITIFAEVKAPFSDYANDLHEYWRITNPFIERKQENINACRVISAQEKSLKYLDAIYRNDNGEYLYPQDGDIFKKMHNNDTKLYLDILNDLKSIITKSDLLYFPLGVGNHVDHIITNMVGNKLKEEGYNVVYYVDFSYEGSIPTKYIQKETIILDDEIIKQKSLAMREYKSQVEMLFESEEKIFDYYKIKQNGKEDYYE